VAGEANQMGMTLEEYASYDATGLAELVRDKEVSPRDLVACALRAIEALNPKLNAVCQTYADEARAAADGPLPGGPFSGVPFLLKDIGAQMAGKRCDAGSRYFSGVVAPHDTELTRRFREAGVIIIGKTPTPELGAHVTTESVLTGVTRNPWNVDFSSGGSSGGASAACAAGIVPFAHANDGLGSIRIPASCCHLFGLKATRQRVPTGPDVGETGNGRHCEFIVSRSVRDSAAMLDAVAGPDIGAPYWAPPASGRYVDSVLPRGRRLRVAVMLDTFTGKPVHAECREAVEFIAALCHDLGHDVAFDAPKFDWTAYLSAVRTTGSSGIAAAAAAVEAKTGRAPTENDLEPLTWRMYREGLTLSAVDLQRALAVFGGVQRNVGAFFARYDVLLSPVLSTPPAPLGLLMTPGDDLELYWDRFAGDAYSPFCGLFNVTGHPAASIPARIGASGLPVGVQIAAGFGREDTIFALASALEASSPWDHMAPPVGLRRMA